MIIVDTSVWIDHLRAGEPLLAERLESELILTHPWVIGELALGTLAPRSPILGLLGALPEASVASEREILELIRLEQLGGSGIGYVDAQLLASCRLSNAVLWTADRRLGQAAQRLAISAPGPS